MTDKQSTHAAALRAVTGLQSSTGTKLIAVILVVTLGFSAFAAAAPSGIGAGSSTGTAGNVDIATEDDSVESSDTVTRGFYAELTNTQSSDVTIDKVVIYDSSGTQVDSSSPAITLSGNSMMAVTTRSNSDSGAFALGMSIPESVEDGAVMEVQYTRDTTSYTDSVTMDINQDDDARSDSLDKYPFDAPQTFSRTVNTSEGSPAELSATVSNGSFDVTFEEYDSANDSYSTVAEKSVSSPDTVESVKTGISGAEDGTEYRVTVEGTGTTESVEVLYDSSTGGTGGSEAGLFTLPTVSQSLLIGGGALVVVLAALYVLREDY